MRESLQHMAPMGGLGAQPARLYCTRSAVQAYRMSLSNRGICI